MLPYSILPLLLMMSGFVSPQQTPLSSQKDDMVDRLRDVLPTVKELMKIGGTAGVSFGVAIDGEAVFTANIGYQDVDEKIEAKSSTIYILGSLTKAFVATVAAKFVDQGLLDWEAPISRYLPDFAPHHKPSLGEELTLVDLLSHSTDLIRKDLLWLGADNEVLVKKSDLLAVCNDLRLVSSPRSKWIYNNWMYALAGEVIERTTGKSFDHLLEEVITNPLGLHSTGLNVAKLPPSSLAKPYLIGDDKTPYPMGFFNVGNGSVMDSAGGIHSNIDDMLKWTSTLIRNAATERSEHNSNEPKHTLPGVSSTLSGRIVMSGSPEFDELYTMGWAKVTIPATFGKIGINPTLIDMPVMGSKSPPPETVFYHNGALVGWNNAVFLIPRRKLSIVVLTNSLGQGDIADWIGQVLLQACLDAQPANDYISLAKNAAGKWRNNYSSIMETLASRRINNTVEPDRNDLIGRYLHTSGAVEINVSRTTSGTLQFDLNGSPSQKHTLQHYHYDTYSFLPSQTDRSRRGLVLYTADSWVLEFVRDDRGHVVSVTWHLDQDEPDGERFVRQDKS